VVVYGHKPGAWESPFSGKYLTDFNRIEIQGLDLSPEVLRRHQELSARRYREVVETGQADQLAAGGRRFGTRGEPVDGGYLVNGRKFFVSLAGAAQYLATPALLTGEGPWEELTLYLSIPRDAPGVTFTGEWDPLGMRATVSREMVQENVRVAFDAEILPPVGSSASYNNADLTYF